MEAGEAFFFDGASAKRRPVRIEIRSDGIVIEENGRRVAFWRFADLNQADAPSGTLRLAAEGAPELARLEVSDPVLRQSIDQRTPLLHRPRRRDETSAGRIVAWSLGAAASLVLSVIYLVPLVADRLAPFVPFTLERRLGEAVDGQVRAMFGNEVCEARAGSQAMAKLGKELAHAADLPIPIRIAVLSSDTPNAFALPGGNVYVLSALLDEAETVDELGGVLAHELGHVRARDGLRKLLQSGGSAFLLGLLFGDVTGGGTLVFAGQLLVDSRYSREAESAADDFAGDIMLELGRSPKPMGDFLARIDKSGGSSLAFIASHPVTAKRVEALAARDRPITGEALLGEKEWVALKAICGKPDLEDEPSSL